MTIANVPLTFQSQLGNPPTNGSDIQSFYSLKCATQTCTSMEIGSYDLVAKMFTGMKPAFAGHARL